MSVDAPRTLQNTVAPLPTFAKKRWAPKPFPESKYWHPRETETCPHCKQPMHSHKFTKREKVESLAKNTQDISGQVILRTAEGIEHRLPTPAVITLLHQVQRTIDYAKGVCPTWIFTRYPRLAWFRHAISAEATDGSNIHEQILSLIAPHMAKGKTA